MLSWVSSTLPLSFLLTGKFPNRIGNQHEMIACTRCGRLHTDVERFLGRRLSCTQVKQFWSRIKNEHKKKYGHLAQITRDKTENWVCFKCNRSLF